MDDTLCHDFFVQPAGTLHAATRPSAPSSSTAGPRRRSPEHFGYPYDAFRQLVHQFRSPLRRDAAAPLFRPEPRGRSRAAPAQAAAAR